MKAEHRFTESSRPFGDYRVWCACGHYFPCMDDLYEHIEYEKQIDELDALDARPEEPEDDGA